MTKIQAGAPVIRETANEFRGRPIVVELHPGFLLLRLKKCRAVTATIGYDAVLERALYANAMSEARQAAAEKPAKPRKVNRGVLRLG